MTCIVGLVEDGNVHIGGDSAGVAGLSVTVRADRKVFKNGDMIFGFTSSFRMGQLLRYSLIVPKRHPETDIDAFMHTTFIDAIRDCLKIGGFSRKENNEETGGCFLVGYAGRLFRIDVDFQIGESVEGYDSVGCGEDLALGSLFTTTDFDLTAKERILTALKAAEKFSGGVRSPFHIEVLKG
jgi:ATP-dependent protease HslVU (ClpYQ) peptidase subunit